MHTNQCAVMDCIKASMSVNSTPFKIDGFDLTDTRVPCQI